MADKNTAPSYSAEELARVFGADNERLAWSVHEAAAGLGVNWRRLQEKLDAYGVPTFMLGNRRMLSAETMRRILSGELKLGEPPARERDPASGKIVGNAGREPEALTVP